MGDNFPSEADIDQVLAVCPELDTNDVRRDLKYTRNVELTVNRALDGRFFHGPQVFDLLDVADQPTVEQPTCDSSTDINSDDDNDLPNITLQPTACTSNIRKDISSDSDSDSEPRSFQLLKKKQVSPAKQKKSSNVALKGNTRHAVNSTAKNSSGKHTFASPSKSSDHMYVEDDVISVESKSSPMEKYNTFKRHPRDLSPSASSSSEDDVPPRKLQREEAKPSPNTKSSGKQATLSKKSAASSVVAISSSDSDSDDDKWRVPLSCRLNISKATPANNISSTKGGSSDEKGSYAVGKSSTVTTPPRSATIVNSVRDGESGLTCSSQRSGESDSQGTKNVNKGKKRSPEEIQERRRQALLKRQEKELERQRKKEEREQLQQEREAKKKMKELEAAKKRAERETFKNMKPGECLKYITVVLDRHLAESPSGGNILTQLHSSESKYQIMDQLVPYSVTWRRTVTLHNFGEDIQLGSVSTKDIEEEETLVYVPVADFVLLVHNYKQQQQGDSCVETLQSFVHGVKDIYQGKKVTLVVQGLEKYFRDHSTQRQRQFRDIVRNNGVMTDDSKKGKRKKKERETENSIIVTRIDVEEALVHLQLWEDVVVKLLEEPEQVADMVRMYTKAVAETPFKRQRDESTFSFHIESNAANCVKVDREGRGLLKVWQRHIQQMRNVSPEMSAAIVAEYPSPQLLLQAYERCSTEKEAQMLLKDIMVRRGAGVLATSRRITILHKLCK
ncbi:PREDICTED: crossover junction endonuclease EME1-like [Branchiostoma belcheri]|uniref:Crossover junction endonuclease EME1-like n=1 Tax=Branchiostoma belcheri TaxID=7741 RepID=A0A6P5AH73_BRABE|nr:PREDICTED: crossover junction endonuclease EME1-like [Branchiostoma belcheri]